MAAGSLPNSWWWASRPGAVARCLADFGAGRAAWWCTDGWLPRAAAGHLFCAGVCWRPMTSRELRQRLSVAGLQAVALVLLALQLYVRTLPATATPIPTPESAEAHWWGLWPVTYLPGWLVAVGAVAVVAPILLWWTKTGWRSDPRPSLMAGRRDWTLWLGRPFRTAGGWPFSSFRWRTPVGATPLCWPKGSPIPSRRCG